MITFKEWMELVEYRITEGNSYGWRCFGDKAQCLSYWNGDQDGWSADIVFDTQNQTVYVVEVCDYKHQRAYRMINPDFQQAHDDEAKTRGTDAQVAWDYVRYIDLEDDDDFCQKFLAIRAGKDYDTRVSIPVNLPDDVLLILMKQAHERDITFNQLIEEVIRHAIEDAGVDVKFYDDDADQKFWDDLAEDDHWDDEIVDDEPVKKKKKKSK